MKLICGLGNPGRKFKGTRHNLGFLIVDEFKKRAKFPKFKLSKKFFAKISKGKIGKEEIILAKPQTFMNESGKSIKILIEKFKLKPENLILIQDDIDLPLGKIKVSFKKGSGGHKGVQSVIDELKTKDFWRIRIGICPKERPKDLKEFVLKKFKNKERKILKRVIEESIEKLNELIKACEPHGFKRDSSLNP